MFRRLLIATLIGILAALAVAAFRHAMQLLEWIFLNNDTGSLVNAAEGLSPWRRLITPALGGLAAGLLLWGWQKMNQQRPHAPTDYMEALQTDGQFDVGASLVKSLASLLVVVSGSAIGREGAMILLAALAASSFADASRRVRNGNYGSPAAPLRAWRALTMRRWRAACLSRKSCSVP